MVKFILNRRTMQMVPEQEPRPTLNAVFLKVKRINFQQIAAHSVTDDELTELITKVLSGKRNTMYLFPGHEEYKRKIEIFYTINREIPFGSERQPK